MSKSERLIAYLDLLGFKDFVTASERRPELVPVLDATLRRASEWVGGPGALGKTRGDSWRIRTFSDSIVVSCEDSELGLCGMLEGVSRFQRDLVAAGFALRGGISAGSMQETRWSVVSSGLIDAYALEQTADYPRIVAHETILARVSAMDDAFARESALGYLVRDSEDQIPFLCYLQFHEDEPWFSGDRCYQAHKRIVEEGLRSTDARVLRKMTWLAAFHNWCLRSTARNLKESGTLSEDDVWDWTSLEIKSETVGPHFVSLLRLDDVCEPMVDRRHPLDRPADPDKIDWLRQWPGARTEDDEMEPDREPDLD